MRIIIKILLWLISPIAAIMALPYFLILSFLIIYEGRKRSIEYLNTFLRMFNVFLVSTSQWDDEIIDNDEYFDI